MSAELKHAAQRALDDICGAKLCEINSMSSRREMIRLMNRAIDELRSALAQQPTTGEPVAQAGLTDDQLREAFAEKSLGMNPNEHDMTIFALGVEVGAGELAAERQMARMYFNERNSARDAWRRAADERDQLKATTEPVDFPAGAIVNGRTLMDRIEAYPFESEGGDLRMCSDWHELRRCFEHLADYVSPRPAPSVPKDDQIAALVNKVRDIARMFHDHQSLRERIAIELVPALKASQEVKSNAERWHYAIADGGNQSMNFIDIFNGWNGDGDFVEAFDAAMLAANEGGK